MVKILCVSMMDDDHVHLIRLTRKVRDYKVLGKPNFDAEENDLLNACKWADEVYINKNFSTVCYKWDIYHKIRKSYLKALLQKDARQEFDKPGKARVAFKEVGQVSQEGVSKKRLASVAVLESEISRLEQDIFGKFRQKIKHINTLPAALCATIARSQKVDGDFLVVWVQTDTTIIAVASPDGLLKVARQIPIGFPQKDHQAHEDSTHLQNFVDEIGGEIERTVLYHSQTFPESSCSSFFLIGNPGLEKVLKEHPVTGLRTQMQFGLAEAAVHGLDTDETSAAAQVIGTVFCHQEQNLVDPNIFLVRRLNIGYRLALGATAAAILVFGLRLYLIDPVDKSKMEKYNRNNELIQDLAGENAEIQSKIQELDQFKGWESFYKNTYKNQPFWDTLFTSIAKNIPSEVVLDTLELSPGKGSRVYTWTGRLTGHIRIRDWNRGLEILREFGARLHASNELNIVNAQYSPEDATGNRGSNVHIRPQESVAGSETDKIDLHYQLRLELVTQDTHYEG